MTQKQLYKQIDVMIAFFSGCRRQAHAKHSGWHGWYEPLQSAPFDFREEYRVHPVHQESWNRIKQHLKDEKFYYMHDAWIDGFGIEQEPGWYFHDEAGLPYGPYSMALTLLDVYDKYCEYLDRPETLEEITV